MRRSAYTAGMMRTGFIVLMLGILSSPLAAQDAVPGGAWDVPQQVMVNPSPDTKVPKTPPPAGRIVGTVLCGDTHRPARGAMLIVGPVPGDDGTVSNGGMGSGMARVGIDGSYVIEHLSKGEYTVIATLPGYLSQLDDIIGDQMSDSAPQVKREQLIKAGIVTISGNETARHDITLQRGAAVSGHVYFSDGSPAPEVSIEVEDVNAKKLSGEKQRQLQMGEHMFRTMFTRQSLDTDDRGMFRLSGLKPGTYRVVAIPSLANNVDTQDGEMAGLSMLIGSAADPSALRVYSGDTLHSKAAKKYELRSGDELTGVDITIPLNAYHEVKGTLTAVDGRVINKATLTLVDTTDDSVSYESEVTERGEFRFPNVAAGTYTLSAKEAQILERQGDGNPNAPLRSSPVKQTNAFADGSEPVNVKDSDVPDVSLTLTEVPLPAQPEVPAESVQD